MDGQLERPRQLLGVTLWHIAVILVLVGIFVSGYLSYAEFAGNEVACVEGSLFDCDIVRSSVYSQLLGIPVAYLGLGTYLVLLGLLLFQERTALLREYGTVLLFGITLFAFLYSLWLVYVQVVLLQALCPWCLTHEVVMVMLFLICSVKLKREFTR